MANSFCIKFSPYLASESHKKCQLLFEVIKIFLLHNFPQKYSSSCCCCCFYYHVWLAKRLQKRIYTVRPTGMIFLYNFLCLKYSFPTIRYVESIWKSFLVKKFIKTFAVHEIWSFLNFTMLSFDSFGRVNRVRLFHYFRHLMRCICFIC